MASTVAIMWLNRCLPLVFQFLHWHWKLLYQSISSNSPKLTLLSRPWTGAFLVRLSMEPVLITSIKYTLSPQLVHYRLSIGEFGPSRNTITYTNDANTCKTRQISTINHEEQQRSKYILARVSLSINRYYREEVDVLVNSRPLQATRTFRWPPNRRRVFVN